MAEIEGNKDETLLAFRMGSWGICATPADIAHQYGWKPPVVEGQNGTTAVAGDDFTGVFLNLKSDSSHATPGRLNRFIKLLDSALNKALWSAGDPPNMSSQNFQHREWLSPDRKKLALTLWTGKVKVNRTFYPYVETPEPLWTCVYQHEGQEHLFVVGVFNTYFLRASRRPTAAGGAWSTVATLDLRTLDAAAGPPGAAGWPSSVSWWIKKVDANQSLTICSIWIQNPTAETSPNASKWIGVTDIDMATGGLTHTRATAETCRSIRPAHSTNDSWTETFAWSGVRQIAFEYVGDTKVFTELEFTGGWQRATTQVNHDTDYSFQYTVADDRQVVLRRGAYEQLLFSRDIGTWSWAESGSYTPSFPGSTSGPGTATVSVSRTDTYTLAAIKFYGGRGDTFVVRKEDRTFSYTLSSNFSGTISNKVFSWPDAAIQVDGPKITVDHLLIGPSTDLPNGSYTAAAVTTHPTPSPNWPSFDSTTSLSDSNPTNTPLWGSANAVTTPNTATDMTEWVQALPVASGHPEYAFNVNVGDVNYMNGRTVDDFLLLSIPKLRSDETLTLDPTKFTSYCSDPTKLADFNVDALTGVIKNIRLDLR